MVVEDDHQPLAAGLVDDDVHRLLRRLAGQRRVVAIRIVDPASCAGVQRLNRERHPNRVETLRFDLRQHLFVIAAPKAMRGVVSCLKAEPVDALQHDLVARSVNDLCALRLQRHHCGGMREGGESERGDERCGQDGEGYSRA